MYNKLIMTLMINIMLDRDMFLLQKESIFSFFSTEKFIQVLDIVFSSWSNVSMIFQ